LWIELPGIFTIKNYRHYGASGLPKHRRRRLFDSTNKVFRGFPGRHTGIDKADKIRKRVVAKDHVHGRGFLLPAINTIETIGTRSIKRDAVAAMKRHAYRPA
jgi:hypothetical protein